MTDRIDYVTRRAIVIDEYEPHCPVITGEIIIDLYDLADLILDTISSPYTRTNTENNQ